MFLHKQALSNSGNLMNKSSHLILIPTYNEATNIVPMIQTILSLHTRFDICFMDDNSPDGTATIIKEYQETYPQAPIHLIERQKKEGLGPAYMAGFKYAIDHHYTFIYQMDCDFSHDPKTVLDFRCLLEKDYDFVIGSRYVNQGLIVNWSFIRKCVSRLALFYVQLLTGLPIQDSTSGFNGIRCSLLADIIQTPYLRSLKGYGFQVALKYFSWKQGARLTEHPICFEERRAGQSKFNGMIIIEAILKVFLLRFK